jgi:hypothetical protein
VPATANAAASEITTGKSRNRLIWKWYQSGGTEV